MKEDLELLSCNWPVDVGMWVENMLECRGAKALEITKERGQQEG